MKDILDYNNEENKKYYTFNLNLLSLYLAKLVSVVENKEYIFKTYKSKEFSKDVYNFAHVIVNKNESDKDFMDYYQHGMNVYTFLLAYYFDNKSGFVLHQDSAKNNISEEITFKKHDYNTFMLSRLPKDYDYVTHFINYIITNRVNYSIDELTPSILDNYLDEYLTLYLDDIKEMKIKRLQDKINKLKSDILSLELNINNYKSVDKPKTRKRN